GLSADYQMLLRRFPEKTGTLILECIRDRSFRERGNRPSRAGESPRPAFAVARGHRRPVRLAGGVPLRPAPGMRRLRRGELDGHHAGKRVMTTAAMESTLCRIIAEVLGLDLVRPEDGFFEVGGDSVLALQVVARARDAGLSLSARNLFDHQTAGELAALLGELPDTTGVSVAAEPPLLTYSDDEFDDFEETGPQGTGTEAGWETVT